MVTTIATATNRHSGRATCRKIRGQEGYSSTTICSGLARGCRPLAKRHEAVTSYVINTHGTSADFVMPAVQGQLPSRQRRSNFGICTEIVQLRDDVLLSNCPK